MFNADEGILASEEKQQELRDMVAPAEAVFLDAKLEADLGGAVRGEVSRDAGDERSG